MMGGNEEEHVMGQVFGGFITAVLGLKVDTAHIENIAKILRESPNVEDLFLVTGDLDLILKVYENVNDLNGDGRFIRGSKGSGTSGRQSSKSRQRANNRNPVGFSK